VALDPIMSLAIALAETEGSGVCLVGAGVSVDAGIPTGWGVQQDLLRHLYQQETEEAAPGEAKLSAWVTERGYGTLGYASVLELVAPDAANRREMLAGYFEDAKPGAAHELLADLAAAGVIKVFVTTNFDQLLEQALRAKGIEPVIVSSDSTLDATPKREHSAVYIVKAHGDYMQETIRNTATELAELEPKLAGELQRIVDNYNVIVVGWAGRDPALAEILRRRQSRYGLWWLSITDPPEEDTQALISATGAKTIVRDGASNFLAELKRRLAVHAQYETGDDPGTVHDETLALVKARDDVALDELLRRERYAFESTLETMIAEHAHDSNEHAIKDGWSQLEPATDRRIASLIPLALHRPALLDREITAMAKWATARRPQNGLSSWLDSFQFPFWIIGMTIGGLAVRFERFDALHMILTASWADPNNYKTPFTGGGPGELGRAVAAIYGPKADNGWIFAEWQWLVTELPKKEWLTSRYPGWLRREKEPWTSFIEFSVLLTIAHGIHDQGPHLAWWTLDPAVATRFMRQLGGDAHTRLAVAEGLGVDLSTFDDKAPETIENSYPMQGTMVFPGDLPAAASALRSGTGGV
jgi:hypothetical protein